MMSLKFRIGDGSFNMTAPFMVDTGVISIPGGDINGGKVNNVTPCGKVGIRARRGLSNKFDLGGMKDLNCEMHFLLNHKVLCWRCFANQGCVRTEARKGRGQRGLLSKSISARKPGGLFLLILTVEVIQCPR